MAEKKWDEWIGEATKKFGGIPQIASTAGRGIGALVKKEVDAYKKLKSMERPKSKDYQSMKNVKDIGRRK